MKVKRLREINALRSMLGRSRAVVLLGPRQCGKSTLAREIAAEWVGEMEYFDLEDPRSAARLRDPLLGLEGLKGLVVIDELQLRPDVIPVLRVLLDRDPLPARFLLLGSASPLLVRGASESLAGRVEFMELKGFGIGEAGEGCVRTCWLRGGFPLSFLAKSDEASLRWREGYLRSLVERDIRMMGVDLPPVALRRFLSMLAHLHGQVWNASEVGRSLQLSHSTARRYLDLLGGALMLRELPPWFENQGKRVVKSPKVYVRDSGLLHALLGLEQWEELEGHPKLGASWEGFAMEEILAWTAGRAQAYFWATHAGAELDLLLIGKGKRIGVEFKYSSAPDVGKSMRIALSDLDLDHLYVLHPGAATFPMAEKISAVGLEAAEKVFTAWLG